MTNIEKIRQEIDTRRQHMVEELMGHEENCEYHRIKGMHDAYVDLLTFLDYSLPEEKPSEDLEEAAEKYADKHGFRVPYDGSNNYYDEVDVKASKDGFIAGAEWQKEQYHFFNKAWAENMQSELDRNYENGKQAMKEQMMKEAAEGEIGYWNQRGLSIRLDKSLEKLGYGEDTEVKIIIVKQ